MSPLKRLLLHLYCDGSAPLRWWRGAQSAAAGRAPVMVLMYHRVADQQPTPWTVRNATFARQIAWLRRRCDIVSLTEAQRRIREGNHRPCVSITFDDGYADNCDAALPLLLREQIPFTYFVTTRFVLEQRPFPHDVALGVALQPSTAEQIRALATAGVEIAGHTRTHADLGPMNDHNQLHDEIVGGVEELQEIIRRPVRHFAFPFGQHHNLNRAAFQIARSIGLQSVSSAYGGYNFPGDDPFHLQRFAVDDDLLRLRNWVTVDRRKISLHPRFLYA